MERDFLDALARLQANKPTDPGLARQAKLGRLRISVAAVATEAKRSRTLIGHEGCRYPRAREAIVAAMAPVAEHRTGIDTLLHLRERVSDLQRAVKLRDSVNAALVMRLDQVEKAAMSRIGQAERTAARRAGMPDPNEVAGGKLLPAGAGSSSSSVVPFRKDRDPST